ncbi:adenylate/guanylate cyclase domain-containing protein [Streptomyces sp. SID8379]|uniref:adenylate/guanylate cyclase domain-containing protein n=1 Tax=unclassified Streptomyces TaxID=2593676 RepID=UPI000367D6D7|nr:MULTISPECIES: adenylate/guanylate cyclase domain-containing protein [unclassified Streptomyces]MYW69446.1 adenylate/guanylate cyclase domain-containing protein [Streptomyces sp. SID8379]
MSAAGAADDAVTGPGVDDLRRAVEEALLGGGPTWTRREVAERSGVGSERTAEIWRALGFPTVDDDARVFTDADIEALRADERLIAAGLTTEESETLMARALGHHLSRLAEWQVHTLWAWINRDAGVPGDAVVLAERAAALLPEMELLQRHVWRRHLAAHAGRVLAETQEQALRRPGQPESGKPEPGRDEPVPPADGTDVRARAVGFTDMVGYTRMTRGLDNVELGRVLDRFESLTGNVVADGGGRVVKTIGDEVLFLCESAAAAADIALELTARAEADQRLPQVRTGLAHGSVLSRFGDVYGATVNVAARLTAVARPGTVLANTTFAGELAGSAAYELKVLRPVSVRGYKRLRPVLLRSGPGPQHAEKEDH